MKSNIFTKSYNKMKPFTLLILILFVRASSIKDILHTERRVTPGLISRGKKLAIGKLII